MDSSLKAAAPMDKMAESDLVPSVSRSNIILVMLGKYKAGGGVSQESKLKNSLIPPKRICCLLSCCWSYCRLVLQEMGIFGFY